MTELADTRTLMDFLRLPLGNSDEVLTRFARLPGADRRGTGPNQFVFVKGHRPDKVLLVAHADTAWDLRDDCPEPDPGNGLIRHTLTNRNGIIRNRSHKRGLGADDRAGCAILWLLRSLGHSLLVTDGEEGGCRGSRYLMDSHADLAREINTQHQFAVEFDRRNGSDYKCYTVGTDPFRAYVARNTGYTEPDRKSNTDIVTLCKDICGVNLSIGYRDEHTPEESLALTEWLHTLAVSRRWLTPAGLPRFAL